MILFENIRSILGAACAVLLFSCTAGAAQSLGERLAIEQTVDADRALAQFLNDKSKSGRSTAYVVFTRASLPDPRLWEVWKAAGVSFAVYLKNYAWIARVVASRSAKANADTAVFLRNAVGAVKVFPYNGVYKASEDTYAGRFRFADKRRESDNNIVVEFFPETPLSAIKRVIAQFHRGPVPTERIANLIWAIRIDPDRIKALADLDQVYVVTERVPRLPLMNEMRSIIGVDDVQAMVLGSGAPPSYALSGAMIRMSNSEGLSLEHPDFKQDLADVVPRWAACANETAHGAMTAGIMLGDGSGSLAGGALTPYQWRGVAPNAIFVCYDETPGSGQPDVANFSFAESIGGDYNWDARNLDQKIRGGDGPILRIPHVYAAGNNGSSPPQYGVETGYYSMLATSKNAIVVGNVDALDLRLQGTGSSLGPTFDNRIKPDVVAPGAIVNYVGDPNGIMLDLGYIRVIRSTTTLVDWSFSPANGFYGWGQNLNNDQWWTNSNLASLMLADNACGLGFAGCLRAHMNAPPWSGYRDRPSLATFARPNPSLPEDLHIVPAANDVIVIKYRIAPAQERNIRLSLFFGNQDIANPADNNNYYTQSSHLFPVIADGNWNVVSIPIGADPAWMAKPFVNYVGLGYDGTPGLQVPTLGTGYGNAGGTSAAAPVVSGVIALMLERMKNPPLGINVANHTGWSPYYRAQPSTGAPLPSTLKAILIHTARDLAYIPHVSDQPNPDTHAPTAYYAGPDYATGYGLVDAQAAIDIIARDGAAAPSAKNIYEDQFTTSDIPSSTAGIPCSNDCPWGYREYVRVIPAGRALPLKVTLAYDDYEGADNPDPAIQVSPRLVNAIDLELISPSGIVYRPWTLDPLYAINSLPADYPGNIEPEPITSAAVRPARRDQVNDRDNVKQVVVEYPEAGAWKIVVAMRSYGAPPPQTFSLVIDGAVAPPAPNLSGGKIVYVSSLSGLLGPTLQMFVKSVGSGSETQITTGWTNVRDPSWSFNGNYIVNTRDAGWSFGWFWGWIPWLSWQPESIDIRTPTGALVVSYPTLSVTGRQHAKYPDWSPDGRHIVVTSFDIWGERELRLITFGAAYAFSSPTVSVLVPTNFAGNSDDPGDGEFSKDGKYVYFNADSNVDAGRLYKVNVASGGIEQIFGNGAPMHRAYSVSISSDDSTLIFNSELYQDGVPNQIDEELLAVGLMTGTISQMTHMPGNQYGRFAKNGLGKEILLQSNLTPNGPYDLFLFENGTMSAPVTTIHKVAGGSDWVK